MVESGHRPVRGVDGRDIARSDNHAKHPAMGDGQSSPLISIVAAVKNLIGLIRRNFSVSTMLSKTRYAWMPWGEEDERILPEDERIA